MDSYIYGRAGNILTELKTCSVNLRRMEYTISSLKPILLDAEEKEDRAISKWLKELENVFSQIEESIIDRCKCNFSIQGGIGKQVCASFLSSDRIAAYEANLTCERKKLCDQLDAIATKMYEFHLTEKSPASIGMWTTHSFVSATEVSTRLMKPSWQLLYSLTDAPKVYHNDRYNSILEDFKNSTHEFFHIVGEAGIGNHGSKIIVTTQCEAIADALTKVYKPERQSKENQVVIDTVSVPHCKRPSKIKPTKEEHQTIFKVERLSVENSLSLFKNYAFGDTQEAQNKELNEIENQIVNKCEGVPLAIKCIGSLLSSTARIVDWKNVNDKLDKVKDGDILPTLRLCYNLMPLHLKRCFLHSSQLPNNRLFTSNDLIQLWMAHGLLHSPKENNLSLENIGEKYFMELWSRFFVQEIEEYGLGYWFKLHPLIQKLAHVLAQEQAKCSVVTKRVTEIRSIAFPVRDMVPPGAFLVNRCISNFKRLSLLYLGNTNLEEIPNAIGALMDLRYLDLQGNKRMKRLPNSICNLQRLQTLILASCSALEELPKDIRKLIELRYLWVTANKLHLHKNGVGSMTSLRFLAIGGCENLPDVFERAECLEGLETLMIYNCVTLKSLPNEMGFLKSLQNLVIWSCKQLTLTSLQKVEFKLQRFTMRELPKVRELPRWLRGSTETLRILEIINCPIIIGEKTFTSYEEVQRRIVDGAVYKRAAGSFQDLNDVKRGPKVPEIMKNNYY